MESMIEVSKEEFFAYIGPRDIVLNNGNPDFTSWETRLRTVVGRTIPGWTWKGAKPKSKYMLTEDSYKTLKTSK